MAALGVPKATGQDEDDVNQLPYAQQAPGEKPENARADLAHIDPMDAGRKRPNQGQQQGPQPLLG